MNKVLLVGGGGHCVSCIDLIEQTKDYRIIGILEKNPDHIGNIFDYPVLGDDKLISDLIDENVKILVTIGQILNPKPRVHAFERARKFGAKFINVVSTTSYVSRRAKISEGTVVMHGAIVNSMAKIGFNCIINSQALVEHGSFIGNHCHISTGAKINGDVAIGNETFVGSGSIIKQGVRIGNNVVVGAGKFVDRNLPDNFILR